MADSTAERMSDHVVVNGDRHERSDDEIQDATQPPDPDDLSRAQPTLIHDQVDRGDDRQRDVELLRFIGIDAAVRQPDSADD